MERRPLILYLLLFALAVASGVLAYYAIQSARQSAHQAERSVLASTLLLVDEKVDRVEQLIISADEAAFHLVNPTRIEAAAEDWQGLLAQVAPSVDQLVLLSADGMVPVAVATRTDRAEQQNFLSLLRRKILADLHLRTSETVGLRHLHKTYDGRSRLISVRAFDTGGGRLYAVASHDVSYFLNQLFPSLLTEGEVEYGVIDNEDRALFGRRLSNAGEYVVGRRFPTTLYAWRLQVAPRQAGALSTRREERFRSEMVLISIALLVLFFGLGFAVYAITAEARLNRLRQEFVANVTHELKTPLTVIRMYADLLISGRVKDANKGRAYLDVISRETERLGQLIENVLDFSALEQGKQVYQLRTVDLLDLLRRAIETARTRLESEHSEISLSTSLRSALVDVDEQSLFLVVMNLLDNAAKYGRGGAIEVRLEEGRRHYYVRVRDHGPGIPEEHHRKVFERFFRVRDEQNTARGSGIGLSLVKRIVEAHRGNAWVENAPGGGAIVAFSIPRAVTPTKLEERQADGGAS